MIHSGPASTTGAGRTSRNHSKRHNKNHQRKPHRQRRSDLLLAALRVSVNRTLYGPTLKEPRHHQTNRNHTKNGNQSPELFPAELRKMLRMFDHRDRKRSRSRNRRRRRMLLDDKKQKPQHRRDQHNRHPRNAIPLRRLILQVIEQSTLDLFIELENILTSPALLPPQRRPQTIETSLQISIKVSRKPINHLLLKLLVLLRTSRSLGIVQPPQSDHDHQRNLHQAPRQTASMPRLRSGLLRQNILRHIRRWCPRDVGVRRWYPRGARRWLTRGPRRQLVRIILRRCALLDPSRPLRRLPKQHNPNNKKRPYRNSVQPQPRSIQQLPEGNRQTHYSSKPDR